ncbi:hypothetical protein BJF79_13445 [Actinomadura sp. CNU-125]|uniref:hypothetical protein n=1 Tax=Actinomadura sp. CNU-125 TaxID=1904961 RepID=UPI00095DF7D3|nr:hypothetical protein [Actinomadura sp. CNU-125]OLT24746.1 hypothetical protein BJF79_13445 [Actinomadura sp. CNU-125]
MSGNRSSVPYVPPEVATRVVELLGKGQLVKAVAEVRKATGADLVSAKSCIDEMRLEWIGAQVPVEAEEKARALLGEGRAKDAVKLVRDAGGLGRSEGKDFVRALQAGWRRGRTGRTAGTDGPGGTLADRARGFVDADDHASAVALVRDETGMNAEEAERFVDALD